MGACESCCMKVNRGLAKCCNNDAQKTIDNANQIAVTLALDEEIKEDAPKAKSYLPMSEQTINTIKATAAVVAPHAKNITTVFYKTLFTNNPEALSFFNKSHQSKGSQPEVLAHAVVAYASNIDNLGALGSTVKTINNRHCALNVTPGLYKIVHDNLMLAIGEVLGDAVTPEIGTAWSNAVMALAEILHTSEEKLYQATEKRKGNWRGFKDFKLTRKVKVAEDTVEFTFACDNPVGIEFDAGQYLTIRLGKESGIQAPRHYTVTSRSGDAFLQCTTRLVSGNSKSPEGAMSSYMHKKLNVGDTVSLSPPYGLFTPKLFEKEKVAFITAGIGITPALAMAKSGTNCVGALHIDRSADYDGLSKTLEKEMNLDSKMRVVYNKKRSEYISEVGSFARQVGDVHYMICGPPGFMWDATKLLKDELKVPAVRIHVEKFGTGAVKSDRLD